jgi:hypothetical protein
MRPRQDAPTIPVSLISSRAFTAALLLEFMIQGTGCSGLRSYRDAPRSEATEFRAAAQSVHQLPAVEPPPPVPEKSGTSEESPLQRLARIAADSEKKLDNYLVRVRRRETVNGEDQPLEYILCKFRRAPLSMHCKWLGTEAKGREIIYVKGQFDDKIHLLTGQGDLFGPGHRMSFSPESPLVRARFRYPLVEASLGANAVRFVSLLSALETGQARAGTAKYLGSQLRPEFPRPMEVVEQSIPPNLEPGLEKGGIRFYYFDDVLGLPMLIVTFDHNRHQVEYYCFDRLQAPVPLDDADFNPAQLWPKPRG